MHPRARRALLLALALFAMTLTGCVGDTSDGSDGDGTDGSDGDDPVEPTGEIPRWELGNTWTYTVTTEEFPESESTMIVYGDDGNNYLIGTTDRRQALIHALFNVNPQLGRIQKGNLAVYEQGEPRAMYEFPVVDGQTFTTDLFVSRHGGQLNAEASYNEAIETAMGTMEGFEIVATNAAGFTVEYDYIPEIAWFSKLVVTDPEGTLLHDLRVTDHQTGASGTGWFVRGDDLFDEPFAPGGAGIDTQSRQVLVDGTSAKGGRYGAYDLVAYNVKVEVQDPNNDRAQITITDGDGNEVFSRTFLESQENEFSFDVTRDFAPGEWDVSVTLGGQASARVRLAGAWEYSGSV